jgi:alpha-tubulin suppressor-like RCC1 family protein
MVTHDGGSSFVTTAVQFDAETAGAIALGDGHACFVSDTTGTIRCAGVGSFGRLGDGLDTSSATLVIATTQIIK